MKLFESIMDLVGSLYIAFHSALKLRNHFHNMPETLSLPMVEVRQVISSFTETLTTLVQNFKAIPSPSPKLLNLNQRHPTKKLLFLVKSL